MCPIIKMPLLLLQNMASEEVVQFIISFSQSAADIQFLFIVIQIVYNNHNASGGRVAHIEIGTALIDRQDIGDKQLQIDDDAYDRSNPYQAKATPTVI